MVSWNWSDAGSSGCPLEGGHTGGDIGALPSHVVVHLGVTHREAFPETLGDLRVEVTQGPRQTDSGVTEPRHCWGSGETPVGSRHQQQTLFERQFPHCFYRSGTLWAGPSSRVQRMPKLPYVSALQSPVPQRVLCGASFSLL